MPQTDVPTDTTTGRDEDEMWGLKTVVAKTGLSRSTLYAYVSIGLFPKQRRLGVRRVAWLASDVRAWIASRPQ
jgi:prophage regulatory protein